MNPSHNGGRVGTNAQKAVVVAKAVASRNLTTGESGGQLLSDPGFSVAAVTVGAGVADEHENGARAGYRSAAVVFAGDGRATNTFLVPDNAANAVFQKIRGFGGLNTA